MYMYAEIFLFLYYEKKSLYSDGKLSHQYQQNEQPPFRKRNGVLNGVTSNHCAQKRP